MVLDGEERKEQMTAKLALYFTVSLGTNASPFFEHEYTNCTLDERCTTDRVEVVVREPGLRGSIEGL